MDFDRNTGPQNRTHRSDNGQAFGCRQDGRPSNLKQSGRTKPTRLTNGKQRIEHDPEEYRPPHQRRAARAKRERRHGTTTTLRKPFTKTGSACERRGRRERLWPGPTARARFITDGVSLGQRFGCLHIAFRSLRTPGGLNGTNGAYYHSVYKFRMRHRRFGNTDTHFDSWPAAAVTRA
jgi:hypothetical protein